MGIDCDEAHVTAKHAPTDDLSGAADVRREGGRVRTHDD